jgi:proteasome lid subunit RPN8/RPN11
MEDLVLSKVDYERICAQALAEYGDGECCGMLTRSAQKGPVEVHVCENIQGKMHEQDPEQFPRTTMNAYLIDPGEQYRIISAAEGTGGGIAGFYHSHVDCDAYFSEEDKAQACALFGDEPTYPDAVYLVISVYGPRSGKEAAEIKEHKCFGWSDEQADYVEVPLQLVD